MRRTLGVHHVGLAVDDCQAAARFFVDALGFVEVRRDDSYPAVFVSDDTVLLTLWQVEAPGQGAPFDRRKNPGLHHLALRVSPADLDDMGHDLSARDDVTVLFPPELLRGGPARHMMIAGPSGLRIELIATP